MSTLKGTLTAKQLVFCNEFMASGDRVSSAISAGFSKSCAPTMASRLLARKDIQQFIGDVKQETAAKIMVTEERVARELAALAFANIADCYDDQGFLLPLSEMSESAKKAIESIDSIEIREGAVAKRIKTHNKIACLKMLGDYMGMFDKPEGNNEAQDINVVVQINE